MYAHNIYIYVYNIYIYLPYVYIIYMNLDEADIRLYCNIYVYMIAYLQIMANQNPIIKSSYLEYG